MEIVYIELLDHHPVRDYDFYVEMFGNTNHTQVKQNSDVWS